MAELREIAAKQCQLNRVDEGFQLLVCRPGCQSREILHMDHLLLCTSQERCDTSRHQLSIKGQSRLLCCSELLKGLCNTPRFAIPQDSKVQFQYVDCLLFPVCL